MAAQDIRDPSGHTGGYPFEETPAGAFLSEQIYRRDPPESGFRNLK
jgi:hypothetical protein